MQFAEVNPQGAVNLQVQIPALGTGYGISANWPVPYSAPRSNTAVGMYQSRQGSSRDLSNLPPLQKLSRPSDFTGEQQNTIRIEFDDRDSLPHESRMSIQSSLIQLLSMTKVQCTKIEKFTWQMTHAFLQRPYFCS